MRKQVWLGLLSLFFAVSTSIAACGDGGGSSSGGTAGSGGTTTTTTGMAGMGAMGGHNHGGGGTGGSVGGTGAIGGSGEGGAAECFIDDDCGKSDDCHTFKCDSGICNESFAATGTPIFIQAAGDCKLTVCDGAGNTMSADDATDVFDDLNDCTDDTCTASGPANDAKPVGTGCASMGGAYCDGAKACVECILPGDCATGVCSVDHTCAPAECGDGVSNGSETDIDCGGPVCGKCATGKVCDVGSDCVDLVCDPATKTCSPPSCSDAAKNGSETDVDCGGPMCVDCLPGKACGAPNDCTTGVCSGNPLTCQSAVCNDGVKNGAETDLDCGGPTCADCANGKLCSVAGDCVSGVCSGNPTKTCQVPTCMDGVKNGTETGQDCGGGCNGCVAGGGCNVNTDCAAGLFCNAMSVCAAPACNDGLKNGMETDVDCGGPTCPDCVDGKTCSSGTDCVGGFCLGPPVCQSSVNGCTLATAFDHTGDAITTVTQTGFSYVQQCIKIKAGKQVKVDSNFVGHPLSQGIVVNGVAYPEMGGPIPHTTTGTTATFTFPATGTYGYYCDFHYGFGMYGTIFVVP